MNDFDHSAGFATERAPQVVAERLGRLAKETFTWSAWFSARAIPLPSGPPRTADVVSVVDSVEAPALPTMLIHEFQSEHDPEQLDNTLMMADVFRVYARHEKSQSKFRVLVGLIYLKGECPQSDLEMTCLSGAGTVHRALVWNVANDSAEEALQQVATRSEPWVWGLLFWIPLMTGADDRDIIHRWRLLVQDKVEDPAMQRNVRVVALKFAELTRRFLVWNDILGEWNVGESMVANTFRAQGELKKARAWLLRQVMSKYKGEVTPDFPQTIEQQDEVSLLDHWYELALEHDTWDKFVAALK